MFRSPEELLCVLMWVCRGRMEDRGSMASVQKRGFGSIREIACFHGDLQGSKATSHKRANWTPGQGSQATHLGRPCWAAPKPAISPRRIPGIFYSSPTLRRILQKRFPRRTGRGWRRYGLLSDDSRTPIGMWIYHLVSNFVIFLHVTVKYSHHPVLSVSLIHCKWRCWYEECNWCWHGWWAVGFTQTSYVLLGPVHSLLSLAAPQWLIQPLNSTSGEKSMSIYSYFQPSGKWRWSLYIDMQGATCV